MYTIIPMYDNLQLHHTTCSRRETLLLEWPVDTSGGILFENLEKAISEHVCIENTDGFVPTKLWQVLDATGKVWCETSNEREARNAMNPGYTLQRLYKKVQREWVMED